MKKLANLLFLLAAGTFCSQAQVLPKVSEAVISEPWPAPAFLAESNGTSYAYPDGLSKLGTHSTEDRPVCNYLSFNKLINKGYFLWAPTNQEVIYKDNSTNSPTQWNWEIPGSESQTGQTVRVKYTELGNYDFPTLTTDGGSYKAEGRILVSGKAEITTANCRKWGETYQVGYLPLKGQGDEDAGYLGGTNTTGMKGFGNLFMTAHGNAHITGVNVYFAFKPTVYEQDAKLLLRLWYPMEDENGGMLLTGLPLEVVELPFSEIRDAEEGEFPIKNVAVGEFKFEKPLQIWDKPMFFVTVEGFGEDITKTNAVMLTEVMGQDIPTEQMNSLLAHNSFVDYMGNGYTVPINYFGAMPGASFMICPMVDNLDGDAGVNTVNATADTQVSVSGNTLTISNPDATDVRLVNMAGVTLQSVATGGETVELQAEKGAYVIQVLKKGTQIDVKKIIL